MSEAAAPSTSAANPGTARLLPDRRLVERASRGDRRAFAAIYKRHSQALYRYCLAILGNPQDAQDALQATMEKALSALPGEKRELELKPWLFRIAHNESIDLIRRRRGTVELDPESIVDGPGLAAQAETRDRLRGLIADLGELPERQRGALVLRELSGLDFDEIGAALGTSPAVARQTLYEARIGLRQAEDGREMSCDDVARELSGGDGRVARRRDIRAHLRTCAACRRFREEISERSRDFAALTPLPAVAATGILSGLLGGSGGGGAGIGVGGALGGGAAKTASAGVALKATAAVAVVAAVGTVAADRGGLIESGVPGGAGGSSREAAAGGAPAAGAAATEDPGEGAGIERRARAEGRERARVRAVGAADARALGDVRGKPTEVSAPGGGEGRGLARGREDDLPAASSHGQQTAATHKQSGKAKAHGKPAHAAAPSHPAKPEQAASPPKPPKPAKPEGGGSTKAHPPPAGAKAPVAPGSSPNAAEQETAGDPTGQ